MRKGITRLEPAEQGFFSKKIECLGVPIKSHADVDDKALVEAKNRLNDQIAHSPGILYNLLQTGAEMHIIGKSQVTSDLPYMRHMKGIICDLERDQTIDERTRGVGGLNASCGEENLLKLDDDRYVGRDICRHEFAHTILEYGVDQDTRDYIMCEYKRALAQKRWQTCYSATNYHEYFAELTMWYFDYRGDLGRIEPKPGVGTEWLKSYDPEGWEMIDRIYSGRHPVKKVTYTPMAVLSPEQQPYVRSSDSKDRMKVIFDNQVEENFQILLIDSEGRLQSPRILFRGDRDGYDSTAGSAWLVTDMAGKAVNIYTAGDRPGKAILK